MKYINTREQHVARAGVMVPPPREAVPVPLRRADQEQTGATGARLDTRADTCGQ